MITDIPRAHWTYESIDLPQKRILRYGVYGDQNKPVAVVFLNGRTEYIEKYEYLPKDLNLEDKAFFVTLDHRGQGGSDGPKGHVDDYDDFVSDVKTVLNRTVKDKPYLLIGHSMGGLISLYGTLKGSFQPRFLYIMSPLLGIYHPVFGQHFMKWISFFGNIFSDSKTFVLSHDPSLKPFEINPLTSNKDRYEKMKKTPYGLYPITYGWLRATYQAIDDVFSEERLKSFSGTCPIHITYSLHETIVSLPEIQKWTKKASMHPHISLSEKALKGKHELFSEVPDVYQEVLWHVKERIDFLKNVP